jgi:hypothetical protein
MEQESNMVSTTYTEVILRVRMRCSFANGNEHMINSISQKATIAKWISKPEHWSVMFCPESHGPTPYLMYISETTIVDEVDPRVTRTVDEHRQMFCERMDNEGEELL